MATSPTQLLSPRLKAAMRYLAWADPIYRWRISEATCPNCGGHYFLSMRPAPFMTRCLRCHANATGLSLIPVLEMHRKEHEIRTAWEMSTYGPTLAVLERTVEHVYRSEYFPGHPSGEEVGGILNEDVQDLSFADDSLDLITSNQVFEHVPDDIRGYAECFRVLREGGALVFTVPLYDQPQTEQLADMVDGEIVHLAQPEYHDSRATGPNSVLTFWHHSERDIADRVATVGFDVALEDVFLCPSQGSPARVIYARKPLH